MIALEVRINGRVATVAGRQDLCVLNALIGAIGTLGTQAKNSTEKVIEFNVSGVAKDDQKNIGIQFDWLPKTELKLGDEIAIKIVDTERVYSPIKSTEHDHSKLSEVRAQRGVS